MTCEYARCKVKEGLKHSGVSFGTNNDVEHVVDGYMKVKGGWYVGGGMTHMLKEYNEEITVLYIERMKLTRDYSEELERLAEIGKKVQWAIESEGFTDVTNNYTDEITKMIELYRKDKS